MEFHLFAHIRFWCIISFCMLLCSFAVAQQPSASQPENINLRHFSQERLDEYRADDDFQYDRDTQPSSPGLWQRIKRWIFEKLFNSLENEQTRSFWKWTIYIACGLVIGYVVFKLTQTDLRGAFFSGAQRNTMPFGEQDENIHEMNFDQLIANAISQQQYNLAIRYYYLKTLKQLTDQGNIEWRADKTNQDYVREMAGRTEEAAFQRITFLFEYIYYGNFPISQSHFEQAQIAFTDFNARITKAA